MKKIAWCVVPMISILAVSGAAMAHSGGVYKAKTAAAAIVVDGKLDDAAWKAADTATIDETKVPVWQSFGTHVNGTAPDNPADASVNFKVAYDAKNLYVAIDVKDEAFCLPEDSIEIWFDGQNTGSDIHEYGVHAKILVTPDTSGKPQAQFQRMATSEGAWAVEDVSDGQFANVINKDGYIIEAAIPWASLEEWIGTHTSTMGFDVQMNDKDDPEGARETVFAWSGGDNRNWQDPSVFGDLVLLP